MIKPSLMSLLHMMQLLIFITRTLFRKCGAFRNQQYFCCDRKARAGSSQSFTLWQQATIEITRRDNFVIACSRHIYIWVLFFAYIPFVVNRTFNANREVATLSIKQMHEHRKSCLRRRRPIKLSMRSKLSKLVSLQIL